MQIALHAVATPPGGGGDTVAALSGAEAEDAGGRGSLAGQMPAAGTRLAFMVVGELVEALVLEVTSEFGWFHLSWCSPVRRRAREKSRRNASGVFRTYDNERHGRKGSLDRVDGPRLDHLRSPTKNEPQQPVVRAPLRSLARSLVVARSISLSLSRTISLLARAFSRRHARCTSSLSLAVARCISLSLALKTAVEEQRDADPAVALASARLRYLNWDLPEEARTPRHAHITLASESCRRKCVARAEENGAFSVTYAARSPVLAAR